MLSADDIEKLKNVDVPLHAKVQAIFHGTIALSDYATERIVPLIRGLIDQNEHEIAVIGAYYRMCLLVESLKELKNPRHIQVVCGATRSLFELMLDIRELVDDKALARKYLAFTLVERFRAARLIVEVARKQRKLSMVAPELEFLKPRIRQRVYRSRKKYWTITKGKGPTAKTKTLWPPNWNGETFSRAQRKGSDYELMYRMTYPWLSWYSHSSLAGFGGLSAEGIEAGFGWAHSQAQRFFHDATLACGDALGLFTADPTLKKRLIEARSVLGLSMFHAAMNVAKGPGP